MIPWMSEPIHSAAAVVKAPPHPSFPEVLTICFVAASFRELMVISLQLIIYSANILVSDQFGQIKLG